MTLFNYVTPSHLNRFYSLIITWLLAVSLPASAQSDSENLIEQSSVFSLASQIPKHLLSGFHHGSQLIPQAAQQASLHSSLQTQAEQLFNRTSTVRYMAMAVDKALSADEQNQILEWYQSEPGKAIRQAQLYATSDQGFADMMTGVVSAENNIFDRPDLLELAELLDQQLGLVEFMVDMQELEQLAKLSTYRTLNKEPFDLDQFAQKMQQQRQQMKFNAENLVSMSLAFAFRNIPDQDIGYDHFLQQSVTQLYLKAAMHGLESAKQQMVKDWLNRLTSE